LFKPAPSLPISGRVTTTVWTAERTPLPPPRCAEAMAGLFALTVESAGGQTCRDTLDFGEVFDDPALLVQRVELLGRQLLPTASDLQAKYLDDEGDECMLTATTAADAAALALESGGLIVFVRGPRRIEVGSVVQVREDFPSSSFPLVQLKRGQKGIVQKIDDVGDANIDFEDHPLVQWVSRHDFEKLDIDEAGRNDASSLGTSMCAAEVAAADQPSGLDEQPPSQGFHPLPWAIWAKGAVANSSFSSGSAQKTVPIQVGQLDESCGDTAEQADLLATTPGGNTSSDEDMVVVVAVGEGGAAPVEAWLGLAATQKDPVLLARLVADLGSQVLGGDGTAKALASYTDEDGDACTLNELTAADALEFVTIDGDGRRTLRVTIRRAPQITHSPQTPTTDGQSRISDAVVATEAVSETCSVGAATEFAEVCAELDEVVKESVENDRAIQMLQQELLGERQQAREQIHMMKEEVDMQRLRTEAVAATAKQQKYDFDKQLEERVERKAADEQAFAVEAAKRAEDVIVEQTADAQRREQEAIRRAEGAERRCEEQAAEFSQVLEQMVHQLANAEKEAANGVEHARQLATTEEAKWRSELAAATARTQQDVGDAQRKMLAAQDAERSANLAWEAAQGEMLQAKEQAAELSALLEKMVHQLADAEQEATEGIERARQVAAAEEGRLRSELAAANARMQQQVDDAQGKMLAAQDAERSANLAWEAAQREVLQAKEEVDWLQDRYGKLEGEVSSLRIGRDEQACEAASLRVSNQSLLKELEDARREASEARQRAALVENEAAQAAQAAQALDAAVSGLAVSSEPEIAGVEEHVEDPSARGDVSQEFAEELKRLGCRQAFRIGRVQLRAVSQGEVMYEESFPVSYSVVLQNNGRKRWPATVVLVHASGDAMDLPMLPLGPLQPGERTKLEVDLRVPQTAEPRRPVSTSMWVLRDAATGKALGPVLIFDVQWTDTAIA